MDKSLQVVVENIKLIPERCHIYDAGLDLKSNKHCILHSKEILKIPTGCKVNIKKGYVGYIMSRSGLSSKHGIVVLNSPGVIDSGYKGELSVILINHGNKPFEIEKYSKIAQLIISKIELPKVIVEENVNNDWEDTNRNESGFGSTD